MPKVALATLLSALLALAVVRLAVGGDGAPAVATATSPTPEGPAFDADGALLPPEGYERWIFVGASVGLGYSDATRDQGPGLFHHVYLEPTAYDAFLATGTWPEGTRLVLELHRPAEKVEPSKQGYFEGERLAVEVALKDSERYPGGWAYFDFSNGAASAKPFPREQCSTCHERHAATDNVFTQFYPVLRRAGS